MKPENDTAAIEARLERSLRRQVRAPRLDGRFDAAVWSRIAAEEQRAAPPLATRSRTPKWLVACNALGVAVTLILIALCFVPEVAGSSVASEVTGALPRFSLPDLASSMNVAGNIVAAVAVLFGLRYTRLGRRLLAALT